VRGSQRASRPEARPCARASRRPSEKRYVQRGGRCRVGSRDERQPSSRSKRRPRPLDLMDSRGATTGAIAADEVHEKDAARHRAGGREADARRVVHACPPFAATGCAARRRSGRPGGADLKHRVAEAGEKLIEAASRASTSGSSRSVSLLMRETVVFSSSALFVIDPRGRFQLVFRHTHDFTQGRTSTEKARPPVLARARQTALESDCEPTPYNDDRAPADSAFTQQLATERAP